MTFNPKNNISRRSVLSGGVAAVAMSVIPTKVFALPSSMARDIGSKLSRPRHGNKTLANYLCENVHSKIAARLDHVIADPAMDGEQTALALMEARCPGCGERVHPQTSNISAVVPKWKSPSMNASQNISRGVNT